jgi:hypothetical protein
MIVALVTGIVGGITRAAIHDGSVRRWWKNYSSLFESGADTSTPPHTNTYSVVRRWWWGGGWCYATTSTQTRFDQVLFQWICGERLRCGIRGRNDQRIVAKKTCGNNYNVKANIIISIILCIMKSQGV